MNEKRDTLKLFFGIWMVMMLILACSGTAPQQPTAPIGASPPDASAPPVTAPSTSPAPVATLPTVTPPSSGKPGAQSQSALRPHAPDLYSPFDGRGLAGR